ncbi:hypothetical protein GT755_36125 [Herbidospora sp. NEAU-GS84]|uniref:RHIM domain-containing protein n=1 Tax=Herbidospora solisilvae TaxID=2696284 RepID=A0A7C9J7Y1_9ACTN|nr:hypothetical protein [Herbidospora solisilvae]NAS27082.1 hypothetical protein [Herbidospora solisilvae]
MDPLSITVVGLVAAKLAEGFGGELGTRAAGALSDLVTRVKARISGDPEAEAAMSDIEAGDQAEEPRETVAEALSKALESDPELREQLSRLVGEVRGDPKAVSFVTHVSGDAQVGKIVTIGEVTGDVSF